MDSGAISAAPPAGDVTLQAGLDQIEAAIDSALGKVELILPGNDAKEMEAPSPEGQGARELMSICQGKLVRLNDAIGRVHDLVGRI